MTRVTAAALAFLALSGCARRVERPIPTVPPPRAEMIPLPPVSERPLVWRPGGWEWTGGDYLWTPGHYIPRGAHGTVWLPGHWDGTAEPRRWIPGHWL